MQFSPISRREREFFFKSLTIREKSETLRFQIFRDEKEKFTYHLSHSYFCLIFLLSQKQKKWSPLQRVLTSDSRIKIVCWIILSSPKCLCWLKLEYCSTTFHFCKTLLVKIQPNSKIWFLTRIEREFEGRIERRNWVFSLKIFTLEKRICSQNLNREEKEKFSSKSRISRGEWEFFLQNLDYREQL